MTVSRYMAANLTNEFIWRFGFEDMFEIEETENSFTIRKQGTKKEG